MFLLHVRSSLVRLPVLTGLATVRVLLAVVVMRLLVIEKYVVRLWSELGVSSILRCCRCIVLLAVSVWVWLTRFREVWVVKVVTVGLMLNSSTSVRVILGADGACNRRRWACEWTAGRILLVSGVYSSYITCGGGLLMVPSRVPVVTLARWLVLLITIMC